MVVTTRPSDVRARWRDLSEEVTGTQCRETPLIVEHLDLAIDDHEELVRQPALVEEVLAAGRSTVSAQRATFSPLLGRDPRTAAHVPLLASTFVDPRTIAVGRHARTQARLL